MRTFNINSFTKRTYSKRKAKKKSLFINALFLTYSNRIKRNWLFPSNKMTLKIHLHCSLDVAIRFTTGIWWYVACISAGRENSSSLTIQFMYLQGFCSKWQKRCREKCRSRRHLLAYIHDNAGTGHEQLDSHPPFTGLSLPLGWLLPRFGLRVAGKVTLNPSHASHLFSFFLESSDKPHAGTVSGPVPISGTSCGEGSGVSWLARPGPTSAPAAGIGSTMINNRTGTPGERGGVGP